MRKSPFSFLGAWLQGQGGGVMEVGGQECPEEMLLGKTFSAGGGQKDRVSSAREDFSPTNTSLVAASMGLPNTE